MKLRVDAVDAMLKNDPTEKRLKADAIEPKDSKLKMLSIDKSENKEPGANLLAYELGCDTDCTSSWEPSSGLNC